MQAPWTTYRSLFLLADEDETMLRRYIDRTERWVWTAHGHVVGVAAVGIRNSYEGEIMAIAVAPDQQGQGTGSAFLQALLAVYRRRGWWTLSVGTGDTGPAQLHFYLKNGFRFDHVRPFFFTQYAQPLRDDWGALRDMVVFKQLLKPLPRWDVPMTEAVWQPLPVGSTAQPPYPVATGDGTPGWTLHPLSQPRTLMLVGAVFDFALSQWQAVLAPEALPADTDLPALWRYWRQAYPGVIVPTHYFPGNKK